MEKYVIIVAGGSGSRMKSKLPKQFMLINGLPVLMHSMQAFYDYDQTISIVLTLPVAEIEAWQELSEKHDFSIPHQVVIGGETRYHSVNNGLKAITENEGVVAVHDGVRPLISREVIAEAYTVAKESHSAVVCVPLKDSIREIVADGSNKHRDRSKFMMVQTPQVFNLSSLKAAYNRGYEEQFTDDASVFEAAGGKITLVNGEYTNIKITTPEDLIIAEALMKKEK